MSTTAEMATSWKKTATEPSQPKDTTSVADAMWTNKDYAMWTNKIHVL